MSETLHDRGAHRTLLAFACLYFFWGSTYAAIHVAGEGLAPPLVAGCRSMVSTVLLVGICVARGKSLRVTWGQFWRLALVGVLIMTVNNILLTWAETVLATGVSSLVIATIPIMVAVIEAALPGGERLNARGWAGTMLGVAGMVALLWPTLRHTAGTGAGGRQGLAYGILLVAALAFAIATVLSRRFKFPMDPFVVTGWELGAAGVMNLVLATAGGTWRTAHWSRSGIEAIGYLAVFGSVVGLSSLTYLLQHVPATKVTTYAFVNPVIAVLLGMLLFHERLMGSEVLGMVIIVAAVAMVIVSGEKRRAVVDEAA